MTAISQEPRAQNRVALDFASLTPADRRTARGVQKVFDAIQDQSHDSGHHKKFIRPDAGLMAAARSPTFSPEPAELTEGLTTEVDLTDDEEIVPDTVACYVFSLDESRLPFLRNIGYWFGSGDVDRFPANGGVDILLPPSNFEPFTSTASPASNFVHSRQGYFAFDPTHGQLWIHARHKGIRVDDRPMAAKSKMLLKRRMRISIGPHRFIFEFKVSDEQQFQAALRRYVAANYGRQHLNEATSATPSTSDVHIEDWVLHGIVGASVTSVIHAASNTRSGEVVAVKRLRFGSSHKKAESEVKLYDDILESIRDNKYNVYVMQKRAVLATQRPYSLINEVYLLWKPLARLGDFSQFGALGHWRQVSEEVKKILFVQVALGLSALHDGGWIHRDLKPANLGIVELGEAPMAVIIDEGQACRQTSEGCQARVGARGTIGYLAPELENTTVARSYGTKVDIWSLGAVAYFLFAGGRIPWSVNFNMFLPARNSQDPTLHLFRETRADLSLHPTATIQHLIGDMLEENPRQRPDIRSVLTHAALRDVRAAIDTRLEAAKSAGQKRSQDALLCA